MFCVKIGVHDSTYMNNIRKIFFTVIISSLIPTLLSGQSVGDYGTVNNGNWSQTNRWRIWDGFGWNTNAPAPPTTGHQVFINHDLNINQDVSVASITVKSGILTITHPSGPHNIAITGDLTLESGTTFNMSGLTPPRTNTLTIGGNISIGNGASFDMQNGSNIDRNCNIIFNGTGRQTVSASGTPTTIRFSNITVDKGTDTTRTLFLNVNPNLTGTVTLTNGTLHARAGIIPVSNTTLTASSKIIADGSSTIITPAGMNFRVQGEISLMSPGASFYFQSIAMPTRSDRTLSVEGNGRINFSAGNLYVWGGVNLTGSSTTNITGGTLTIDPRAVTTPLTRDVSMLNIQGNASLVTEGGELVFAHFNQNTSGPAKTTDWVASTTGAIKLDSLAVTIGIGNATSTTAQGFSFNLNATVKGLTVNTGTSGIGPTTLDNPGNTFEVRDSLIVTSGIFSSTAGSFLVINNPISQTGTLSLDTLTIVEIKGNGSVNAFRFASTGLAVLKKLIVNDHNGNIKLGQNISVKDSLIIRSGNLDLNNFKLSVDSIGLILANQITGNGTIEINGKLAFNSRNGFSGTGNGFAINTSSAPVITLGASSTIDYMAPDTQYISAGQYVNLASSGNGRKILPAGDTIKIRGYFNPGNAPYTSNGSKFEYNGSAQQTLPNQFTFDTLIIRNSHVPFTQAVIVPAGAGNEVRVAGVIRPMTGHLVTNGNLRLVSNANSDGMIAKTASPSAAVSGQVIQERYNAPSAVATRNIGLGLSGLTTSQLKNNFTPFVLSYDETVGGDRNQGYTWLDTGIVLEPGRGYYMYFPTNAAYTMEGKGTPVSGTVQFPGITWTVDPAFRSAAGWCIAANPYPCTIDWMAPLGWTRERISTTIFYLDPVTGQQASFNNGIGTNGATRYIQPGQGFWVKATGANPSITVTEDAKAIVRAKFFREAKDQSNKLIRVGLKTPNHQDEVVLHLAKGYSPAFEPEDDTEAFPTELASVPAALAMIENFTDRIGINRVDEDSIWGHTFPIAVYQQAIGQSTLSINDLPEGFDGTIILTDAFLKTTQVIAPGKPYQFEVTAGDTGWISNRFFLKFRTGNFSESEIAQPELTLYPNPASTSTRISWDSEMEANSVEVFNISGQQVMSITLNGSQNTLEVQLTDLQKGMYTVQVKGQRGIQTGKLMVR